MIRKFILYLIFCTLFSAFANNKVLIVTSNSNTYNNYNNLINQNRDKIPYKVELILVNDIISKSDFSGSKNYFTNQWADPPAFSYYIDNDPQKKVMIYGFNTHSQPNIEIVKILLSKLFLETKISREFPLYLTNIIPEKEIIKLYRDNGVPLILIEGVIKPETIIETLYHKIKDNKTSTHYFILTVFGKTLYPEEKILFIVNGISIFIIIFILNIFSKKVKFHIKHNKKYLPTIPIKIISLFIFYFIATLILEYVQKISGETRLILDYPKTFFIIKNLIVFFIYGICFQIIKDVSISKSPYFYSHLSLYSSIAIYMILAVLYLPLALYQLWPISLTILYIITKRKSAKKATLLLAPLIIIILFINFMTISNELFPQLMLNSKYHGNLILTFLITPYIFLQESFFRFSHRTQKKITHTKDIIVSILTLTITITTIAILIEINSKK